MEITHVLRGLLGVLAMLGLATLFSTNRRAIPWRVVAIGTVMQIVIALVVLKIDFVRGIFDTVGGFLCGCSTSLEKAAAWSSAG